MRMPGALDALTHSHPATAGAAMNFEIATWYDTWNGTGGDNLAQGKVPLG